MTYGKVRLALQYCFRIYIISRFPDPTHMTSMAFNALGSHRHASLKENKTPISLAVSELGDSGKQCASFCASLWSSGMFLLRRDLIERVEVDEPLVGYQCLQMQGYCDPRHIRAFNSNKVYNTLSLQHTTVHRLGPSVSPGPRVYRL